MSRRKDFAIALGVGLLLTGCVSYEGNESSPYYRVPVGSQLTLHREIEIPPDQVGVFIQDGKLLPSSAGMRNYYPHCKFEINTRRDVTRTVAPDQFEITRTVQEENTHAVGLDTLQFARVSISVGVGIGMRVGDITDNGVSITTYATRMYLRSTAQPEARVLSCGQWGYPPDLEHVTIQEIRRALGDIFTLTLPPKG